MKLSFLALLTSVVTHVFAGGIRRGYELLYVWYAYKAETEWLLQHNLDPVEERYLLPGIKGSGEHGTLKLNEFLDWTNRNAADNPSNLGEVFPVDRTNPEASEEPDVDRGARKIYVLLENDRMPERWPNTKILLPPGPFGYGPLMMQTAKTIWEVSQDTPDTDTKTKALLAKFLNALYKMVIAREIDYEKYRFTDMQKAFPNVDLRYDNVQLQTTKGKREDQVGPAKLGHYQGRPGGRYWNHQKWILDPIPFRRVQKLG
ncbi:hypothetical protein BJX66DRAFT_344188 [Aspergillus keveii]|uniref:Uncharacterized protein n=1 Tax=Aspergillus keveii TaxID=714993 RepID=A0ABR4FLZ1_9EURO